MAYSPKNCQVIVVFRITRFRFLKQLKQMFNVRKRKTGWFDAAAFWRGGGRGGGGGGLTWSNHIWQKRYPFRIPSIDKWYPFHTPRKLRTLHPLTFHMLCLKKNVNKSQKQNVFSTFSKPWNASVRPSWPLFQTKEKILLPLHMLQVIKSLPFFMRLSLKMVPGLSSGAPPPHPPYRPL